MWQSDRCYTLRTTAVEAHTHPIYLSVTPVYLYYQQQPLSIWPWPFVPLVASELTELQRGGTPPKLAGFDATM